MGLSSLSKLFQRRQQHFACDIVILTVWTDPKQIWRTKAISILFYFVLVFCVNNIIENQRISFTKEVIPIISLERKVNISIFSWAQCKIKTDTQL